MSVRDRYIAVILAVAAFAGTLALSYRDSGADKPQHAAQSRTTARAGSGAANVGETSADVFRQQRPSQHGEVLAAAFVPHGSVVNGPEPEPTTLTDPDDPAPDPSSPVPVSPHFRRAPGGAGYEAGLVNDTGHPLEIDAVLANSVKGKQVSLHISVPPHRGRKVSAGDGWEIESGDQITLQSPPYQDLVVQVP